MKYQTVSKLFGETTVDVIPISRDGNCLFRSIVVAMNLAGYEVQDEAEKIMQVRSDVHNYIQENLAEFFPTLLANGWDTRIDGNGETNAEVIVRSMRELLMNGMPAGSEVVIAFVAIYPRVTIKINHLSGNVFQYPEDDDPNRVDELQLYFDPVKKHYDVIAPGTILTRKQLQVIAHRRRRLRLKNSEKLAQLSFNDTVFNETFTQNSPAIKSAIKRKATEDKIEQPERKKIKKLSFLSSLLPWNQSINQVL